MAQLELTSFERSALRAQAHPLKPVVMIGDAGLSPSVLKEIDQSLTAHALIKIRVFGDDRAARLAMLQEICDQLGAAPIQQIGKLLVIWRPTNKPAAPKRSRHAPHIPKKKAAARKITRRANKAEKAEVKKPAPKKPAVKSAVKSTVKSATAIKPAAKTTVPTTARPARKSRTS